VYSVFISGILLTIEPYETTFPGGTYCYKQLTRDYAASMGAGRQLRKDVLEGFPKEDDEAAGITVKERKTMIEKKVFHIYLDNPKNLSGAHTRWMSGMLVSNDADKLSYCDPLFEKNSGIMRERKLQENEPKNEISASEVFYQFVYNSVELPSVDSLAIKFPFSDGLLSALKLAYKIIPEMRQLAAEKGAADNNAVVISQCSEEEQICTHYIPLVKGIEFHAGLPPMEEHMKDQNESFDLVRAMKDGLRVIFPFLKPYIEPNVKASSQNDNAEL